MHTALEVEIDHGCLETRFAGAVDQVEPVRRLAEVPLNALDRSGYLLRGKSRGAEKSEHPGPRHRLHDFTRSDAVGHRPGQVGVAETVIGAKCGITKGFQRTGVRMADDRVTAGIGFNVVAQFHPAHGCRGVFPAARVQHVERPGDTPEGIANRLLAPEHVGVQPVPATLADCGSIVGAHSRACRVIICLRADLSDILH